MPDQIDEGLRVLLEHHDAEKSPVTDSLVKECYEVLRQNMYEKDQEVSRDKIRRLVEAVASKRLKELEDDAT